ncbi:hypothetical protein TRIUR3_11687 [Triticum urartu]|uniref:Protein ARV n=1 Tax=Triticum urartu TaxID=4572 RepID=M7YS01_TRIUA|nr:hypothetical protein TRIUR3_11687 [Triticum urartu]
MPEAEAETEQDVCKAVADPYIECEFMIILIDLILHKTRAYRHLLFNKLHIGSSIDKVLGDALLGNIIFTAMLLLGVRYILKFSFDITRYREILLAVIISSYFKLFLLTMMVWEFPSSAIFIVETFVLSSNVVALRDHNAVKTECPAVFFSGDAVPKGPLCWCLLHGARGKALDGTVAHVDTMNMNSSRLATALLQVFVQHRSGPRRNWRAGSCPAGLCTVALQVERRLRSAYA